MDYFYSFMPTDLVTDAAALFQKALEEGIDCILAPDIPECHVRRYERAHKVLRLPSRCGGANITSQHTLAPAAFLTTICAVFKEPMLSWRT